MFGRKPEVVVKQVFQVVEIERPREIGALDKEVAQSVASLQHHPGFTYLLAKLRYQRSALVSHLLKSRQSNIVDVEFIKSGVAWCSWLEDQLNQALGVVNRPAPAEASPDEEAAFKEVHRFLELVGNQVSE